MIKLLLGLDAPPSPHDAADALAVAICHLHSAGSVGLRAQGPGLEASDRPGARGPRPAALRSWRQYRPPAE
jgi:crossover junction endodeoxyribonuclease RuvC